MEIYGHTGERYLCLGMYRDHVTPKARRSPVRTEELVTDLTKEELNVRSNLDEMELYRVWPELNGGRTDWYLTRDEAFAHCTGQPALDDVDIEVCYLNTALIYPVQYPVVVVLERDSKGRFFTRLNTHPELYGHERGKFLFPDRACEGRFCAGPARISLAHETETMGFFTGEMVSYEAESPSWSAILDYLWAYPSDRKLASICHPLRGTYYALLEGDCCLRLRLSQTGEVELHAETELIRQDMQECPSTVFEPDDLLLQDRFGADMGVNAILARFPACPYLSRRFDGDGWTVSDKFLSETVDAAVRTGFLTVVKLASVGVYALGVNLENISNLIALEPEALAGLVREYAEINEKASADIEAALRKGRLRISKKERNEYYV